jgi:hypothetical protein
MLLALLCPLALVAACDKVPLLAPTGSVITLIPQAPTVALNSEMTITATVIENGVSSGGTGTGSGSGGTTTTTRSGNGTPVQNGTVVSFTTSIGRIEPAEARTHNGEVTVKLITGSVSGVATITAYSGGASAQITNLKVGAAAVKSVTLAASPATLGSSGGSSTISATVTDENGGPVGGVAVNFSTDKGTLSPPSATTDGSGTATTTLTTSATAKVSATAGTASTGTAGVVTVTVNPFGLAAFSAAPAATSAGVPVVFTVKPATGANISNVRIDYGDGEGRNLGSIPGEQTVSHAYCSPGSYNATATVTDANGGNGSLSTSVLVGSLPITLAATPAPPLVNSPVTFTASFGTVTPVIDHYIWTFSEGATDLRTSSPQIQHTFTSKGLKTAQVAVFAVGGCQVGSNAITIDVQ